MGAIPAPNETTWRDMLLSVIPESPVQVMADVAVLPLIVFSMLIGIGIYVRSLLTGSLVGGYVFVKAAKVTALTGRLGMPGDISCARRLRANARTVSRSAFSFARWRTTFSQLGWTNRS